MRRTSERFNWRYAFSAGVLLSACVIQAALSPLSARNDAAAIPDAPNVTPNFATYTPELSAVRINAANAPKIDGDLSDNAWQHAATTEAFYEVEPRNGAPPSRKTRAYLMYDDKNLYVAIYAYDDPARITHRLLRRDAPLQDDDGVRILIDSFGTRRDSYFFATNPNGARVDALTENNQSFREEWDQIWNVAAKVVEDGWIAEFAIPFQSISFDASLEDWNLQIIRTIRRTNEEIRWSNIDQTRDRIDMTNPGRLKGIKGIKPGLGLEAQLFVAASNSYDWETDDIVTDIRPSGNVFYKITPSLTGSLTYRPDFSDTPLDSRQVNTGRFSLFFPETRDFFLQDNAVFEFGGQNFRNNRNGSAFFSRNIGIVEGTPTDIISGVKFSGKAGPANVGIITTLTDDVTLADGRQIDKQILSAGRVSVPVFTESKAGVIFTHGDPTGEATNTVGGVDFQFRNSSRWPGQLFFDAAYLRSFDDDGKNGAQSDHLIALHAAYRSQGWNWTAIAREIGENYRPRLGFLNRHGTRKWNGNLFKRWRPKDSFLRVWEIGAFTDVLTDMDDEVLDRFSGIWFFARTNAGDRLFLRARESFLDIREPFQIAGRLPVPLGEYSQMAYTAEVALTNARALGIELEYSWGDIYDGNFNYIGVETRWRPNERINLGLEYSVETFDLPSGKLAVHVAAINSTLAFSPWMTLQTDVQYDNISERFTWFSRFRWEPTPAREVFVSLGHDATIDRNRIPGSFRAQGTRLGVRLGQTLRF